MCLKHVEAWNKLIIKFSASSWLILINKGQQYFNISSFYLSMSPALIQLLLAVVIGPMNHNDITLIASRLLFRSSLSAQSLHVRYCSKICLYFTKHKISNLARLLGYFMLLSLLSFVEPKIRFTLQIDCDVLDGVIGQTHEHQAGLFNFR